MGRFSRLETDGPDDARPTPSSLNENIDLGAGHGSENLPLGDVAGDLAQCLAQGDACFFRGDLKQALRWYTRAMDRNDPSIEPWVSMLHLLLIKGDLSEAKTWIVRGFQMYPNSPQMRAMQAILQARQGMIRQAMNNSDAVLEQEGALALAHMARGQVLVLAGNKNAEHCFEQCLKLAPDSWKDPMLIGIMLQERRMWAKAIHYYAKAAERNESQPSIWYRVGLCRAALAHKAQAQKAYERALELCEEGDPLIQIIGHASTGSVLGRFLAMLRK